MRVTRTVKDYIYKEVSARIHKKYEAEEAQAKYEYEKKEELYQACIHAAAEAAKNILATANLDFIEANIKEDDIRLGFNNFLIKDYNMVNSCHSWRHRFNNEVNEKVDEIIVELELGGDKAKLMEMLAAL